MSYQLGIANLIVIRHFFSSILEMRKRQEGNLLVIHDNESV